MNIDAPYIDLIPPHLRDDVMWQEFASFLDEMEALLAEYIYGMKWFYDIERIPDDMLDFIGYPIAAGLSRADSPRAKRVKILNAVYWHQRGAREIHLSALIELITGVTPEFNASTTTANQYRFVWETEQNTRATPYDFARWGTSVTPQPGMVWSSITRDPSWDRFIVYVDLKRDDLTDIDLQRVCEALDDQGAAYIRYIIGWRSPGWYAYREIH